MLTGLLVVLGIIAVALVGLRGWYALDRMGFKRQWATIRDNATQDARRFDPSMVDGLPAPIRRYLLWSIEPGTPLATRAHLVSDGEFCPKPGGNWWPMQSEGVYAGADGFAWRAKIGKPPVRISGMDVYRDGAGSMTIWMNGIVPMVHAEGDDITRSAAGRAAGECFAVPSLLLPGGAVRWQAVDDASARALIDIDGVRHVVTFTIADDGRPTSLSMMRWSDKTSDSHWDNVLFGADFSGEVRIGGYRIPAKVEAGWGYGTDAWPAGAFIRQRFTGGEYR